MDKLRKVLPPAPDGQVERAIERFAAVALAAELATAFKLTGWNTGDATAAAKTLLQNWLTDRMDVDGLSAMDVLDATKEWLCANAAMVHSQADFEAGATKSSFRAARDKTWIYISAELWVSIHGAEDCLAAARAMVKLGVMDHG